MIKGNKASIWALAWRQAMRDFRAGELRLLMLAVTLAVAALTAVGFFADRLNAGLQRDAAQLLGGDAVVASDNPLPPQFAVQAKRLGLAVTSNATFPSMARAGDDKGGASRLVAVKAVSLGYPLRGQLLLRDLRGAGEHAVSGGPEPGTVWVDSGLLDALVLQIGDPLWLGDSALQIAAVIASEPDRGAGFASFAPRLMLSEVDLPATGLIQPASRVTYRLAVAAPAAVGDEAVQRFVQWTQAEIQARRLRGMRVESLASGRPEMRQTLDRAEKFLKLVALLAALLAAVAVAIAARDFAERHLDDCAMLRVLGQSQRAIAWTYGLEFGLVGLAASVLGCALGFAVHHGFVALLSGLLVTALPAPSAWPALMGVGVGLTLLLGFGLPPVLQLARVPPLRVIRREMGALKASSALVLGAGVAGFAALLLGVASDLQLGLIAVAGFAAAIALFAGLSWLVLFVTKRLLAPASAARRWMPRANVPAWLRLAAGQIAARPAVAVVQVSALGVGLLALILLVLVRTDLIDSWRGATPPDAPNRFVINLQPEQGTAFRQALQDAGVTRYDWYPMIRGRLVTVNGLAVNPDAFADERARRLVEREFNLSHDAWLPAHNAVVAGRWQPEESDALSVEAGLAQTLGLQLGDRLRFDIAGQVQEGRITSLRKVDWGSMRVNFFVMFPRSTLSGLPLTYISAFRAPPQPGFDNRLARAFPNITEIDVSASLGQVQRVLDQVIRAVELLFGFTLAAGLVVLVAAVSASREARAREFAIMRALGAPKVLLARVQRAELIGLGALAGLLAAIAAMTVGWVLARYAFEFRWNPAPWVPLAGAAAGALLALAAGWPGLRAVLDRPVMESLRRAPQ